MAAESVISEEEFEVSDQVLTVDLPDEALQTLAVGKRVIGLRIVPYGVIADHPLYGSLKFEPGAFGTVDPRTVRLRMDHDDPPTGLGMKFDDRADGAYMDFRVSRTQRGDDQLALATDGVSRGASVGYSEIVGKARDELVDGKAVRVYGPGSVLLREVSTTWMPTFPQAGVQYVLSTNKENGPMTETTEVPVAGAIDYDKLAATNAAAIQQVLDAQRDAGTESKIDALLAKFDETIELQRAAAVSVPTGAGKPKAKSAHWMEYTLRQFAGGEFAMSPSEIQKLALDDVITSEQPGLVPAVFTADYDDLINQDRPFLSSTRQITAPVSGMTLTLPVITQRAAGGTQAGGQKTAVTTTATRVGTGTFNHQTILAGADISIQMIQRAERGFFELIEGDLAMAYALDCEKKAVNSLLSAVTITGDGGPFTWNINDGGTMDPENLLLGDAWANSITNYLRAPDTIWMSTAAVSVFIDAKAPLTNAPLYSELAAAFRAGNGTGGTLSGLRPVYVPALDATAVDVIVGPSRGFVWAEDASRRLQADNASLAGQDILLAGGLFPAPRFVKAFTKYVVAGS